MKPDRRFVLKTSLGLGLAAAGTAGAWRLGRAASGTRAAPVERRPAHRVLAQAEDFWGLVATRDQIGAPVTNAWSWIAYDLWQLPRKEEAIIGTGAFMNGAAAGTVSPGGPIWNDLSVPASGRYRVFLRIVDFGHGVNRIKVMCGGDARTVEWGGRPESLARLLRRLRGTHALFHWIEIGDFAFPATTGRVTIEAERAEQPILFVDALYATSDLQEGAPAGWHPLAEQPPVPATPVKRRRTVFPDAQIAFARENVRQFDWARNDAAQIVAAARVYADRPDEQIWHLMPSSTIPRADRATDFGAGCPEHGSALEHELTPWKVDPFEHPYQLQCAIGGEWYPRRIDRTDTASIRSQARREAGSRAPRFIRHYCRLVYLRHVRPAAEALGRAFAITGDAVYAHKAAVLLARVASEYPNGFDRRDRAWRAPYSVDSGMIVDTVLSGYDLTAFATSYDLVFDAIAADASLVEFVRSRLPAVRTAADLRGLIEERLLRTMAQAVVDGAIRGNPGAYESGLATVALCLDDYDSGRFPDSREMIRALYYDRAAQHGTWGVPQRYLSNLIHPNGCVDASVDYGSLVLSFVEFGERIEQIRALHPEVFDEDTYPSVLRHPRVRRHIDFLTDVVCLHRFHPALGDGHGTKLWTGNNLVPKQVTPTLETLAYPDAMYRLFRARPDDAPLARVIAAQAERDGRYPRDLFDRPREDDIRRMAQTAPERPATVSLLDDHGVVLMRAGSGDHERVLTMSYQDGAGDHRHLDALSIGLFGCGLDLLPEIPYGGSDSWPVRSAFELHPLLHNTLVFDGAAAAAPPAHLHWLHETPAVTAASVRSAQTARGRTAERVCALVTVDDERWYVVDVVTASGGKEHHLALRAPIARGIEIDGVTLARRPGTLAAEGGKYGDPTTMRGAVGGLHPFCYMTNVESGRATGPYTVNHVLGDARDVRLKVWGLAPPDATLTFADVRPPTDPSSFTLRGMFVHHQGAPPLASRFVHVLEPHRAAGFIRRVERIDVTSRTASAVRIVMDDRVDTCVVNPAGEALRLPDGTTTDAIFVHRSQGRTRSSLSVDREPIRSDILGVDRRDDAVILSAAGFVDHAVAGRLIRLYNDRRSSMYRILSAERIAGDRLALRLERSSLLAEGRAVGFDDGVVQNSVPVPFAAPGCTLEAAGGAIAWKVRRTGSAGHRGPDIFVEGGVSAAPRKDEIAADFRGGAAFSIHAYGPGDVAELR